MVHESPLLCVVSQAAPHAVQFDVVVIGVEQPPVFGGVGLQSAKPGSHVYSHVVPVHDGASCCSRVVSHDSPHAPQFDVVPTNVSHPSRSGAAVLQSK